jgi:ABC-2 type transport system permease protein
VSNDAPAAALIYLYSFTGLMLRDFRVLRREFVAFLIRTVMNPLLFVFVFTYLFPKIGQEVKGSQSVSFGTILLPGLIAVGIFFQGIMAVALPLSQELGATREIHDRVMAPLPVALVAVEKIVFSALQSILAAIVIFPLVDLIPLHPVQVHIYSWQLLVIMVLLAGLTSGAVGLAIGTIVKPQQIGLIFGVVVVPVTFLGCVYYPWAVLSQVPWLQMLVLVNPVVYMSEGLRAALTAQVQHMPVVAILTALSAALALIGFIGIRGFMHRVVD